MASKTVIICFILLSILSSYESYRILVWFPMASVSHSLLGHGMVRHLLEAGHEVVHVTSFPRGKPNPKLKEVSVASVLENLKKDLDKMDDFKLKNLVGKGNFGDSLFFLYLSYDFHRQFFGDENVKKLFTDPKEKFDAVVIEWFFSDITAGIAALFECPLVWFSPTEAHWQVLKLVDETTNPSYSSDIISVSSPPLSFFERIHELWMLVKKYVAINVLITRLEKSLYENVIQECATKRGVQLPPYEDAVYNGSALLVNSHPSYGTPYRMPQNSKYIGGYHIDTNVPALPQDLQKLMDEAKHGVIYFSMGSNLKSADMSSEMKQSLLKMFSKLKQTVIWKFEEELNNVPPNVHLLKWAPQPSILAHPNLKLFITHGGQLSTTEAIHFGVPVVGMPVLGDQFVNMKSVESKGFGIIVTLTEDVSEPLYLALQNMLQNPSYKLKAKQLSAIYHDRPLAPGQEIKYAVEHVIRTGGARHLRSPALGVTWYQKLYLDAAALLVIIIAALIVIIRRLYSKINNGNNKKEKRN